MRYVGKVEVLEVKGTSYDKLNDELQAVQTELSRVTHDRIIFCIFSFFLLLFFFCFSLMTKRYHSYAYVEGGSGG